MTRSGSIPLTLSSLLQLLTICLLLLAPRCHGASQPTTKTTTKAAATVTTTKATTTATTRKGRLKGGRRKKQWRRRAQDYGEAKQTPTTTFVTNPSSLQQSGGSGSSSSGKGKGGKIIHKAEDYDGRTTIMIKCDQEMKARNRKQAKGPPGSSGGIARKPASDSSTNGKGGKGTAKFGDKASTFSGGSGRDPASASETTDICDEYYDEISGGGWYGGDGEGGGTGTAGDGSGGSSSGSSGSSNGGSGGVDGTDGVDGQVDVEIAPGDPSGGDYPPYDEETGQVSNGVGYYDDLSSCAAIGAGNAATAETDSTEEVTVKLDVVHEIEPNSLDGGSRSILNLMRADLQENVAPVIADCITEFGVSPSGTSPFDDAFTTDGSSVSSGSGSGSFGTGSGSFGDGTGDSGTGGPWNDETLITNANFNTLKEKGIDCSPYSKVFEPTNTKYKCIETTIPVDLYYDGNDTSDFEDRVQTAIDGHKWDVPGLMMTSTVRDSETSDNSITAIEGDKNEEHEPIGPGGFIMIAAAAMVLMLLFLMLVRRKRRDEMVKHVSLEDDDDTYLKDIEQESNNSVASLNRLANLVGEDGESVNSGWTGASTHFRNAANANGAMDASYSNTEARPSHQDVHVCSSATCEVCERNRRGGVQFIPSGATCMPVSLPPAPLPPDGPREYSAEDTVTL